MFDINISGFMGVNCEELAPTTEPPSCLPTDNCDGHYTCHPVTEDKICLLGWSGVSCRDREFIGRFDPACPGSQPCKNGGTCFDGRCCCQPGYTGHLCNTEIIECSSNPCPLGATCLDMVPYYLCICPQGKLHGYKITLKKI